jgi:hypothetical protein
MLKNIRTTGIGFLLITAALYAQNEFSFLVDTNVAYVPATQSDQAPSIAVAGDQSFAVWYGRRTGSSWDIYGTRIDESGTILDPAGIHLASADNDPMPSVASDGTNYLVVWHDREGVGTYEIYGIRVDNTGNVIDSNPIIISDAAGGQMSPKAAFDGTNYLVVWYDSRSGSSSDIYGTRMDTNGTVLNTPGIAISTAAEDQFFPSVSFDGTNYLVVWQDDRSGLAFDIFGARVQQSGVVLDAAGIAIDTSADDQSNPQISFDGTNYLVVWHDRRSGSTNDIYGTRIDKTGTVINPAGIAITTAPNEQYYPSSSFDGTNYLVTWYDRRDGSSYDIYGARVQQSGVVLEPTGIEICSAPNNQSTPSIVFNGTYWLAIWRDERSGGYSDIYGARVEQSGTVLDTNGILVSSSAQLQANSAVAFDGTDYLVVWQEERDETSIDIYGIRVDQAGHALDSTSIAISTSTGNQEYPAVAFDGTNYLVAWQDDRGGSGYDIYGARVAKSGTVLDAPGIAISTAVQRQRYPSIAFDGTNYLVVWDDERGGVSSSDIYGSLVDKSGNVLNTSGIVISDAAYWQRNPSVAFDGTNYLVVWGDYGSGTFEEDIYGARVDKTGGVLDQSGIAISTATKGQWFPSVAFDGTNYLAIWFDRRDGNAEKTYGTRIAQNGTILDPAGIDISLHAGGQTYPAIAFADTSYVAVWSDVRNGICGDVYGAEVDRSGAVIDTFAVSLVNVDMYPSAAPALAHGPADQLLITYSAWADSINSHPANTQRIWGTYYPDIEVEAQTSIRPLVTYSLQVYPNPFRRTTRIVFPAIDVGQVTNGELHARIHDVSGRLVKGFPLSTGDSRVTPSIEWDGTDSNGGILPPGIYFCRLSTGTALLTTKVIKLE